jgi:hypothetical protein
MTNPTKILYVVLLTAGVTLMLVVHVLVVFWAIMGGLGSHGHGATHADEEGGHGGGLSAGELVRLPCHDFESAGSEAGGDCVVFLEAFEAGGRCRQLPRCEHSFHAECVDSWLTKSRTCPVCHGDVVDRPPKGEAKAAASSGVVEMAERKSSDAALEIVTERQDAYSPRYVRPMAVGTTRDTAAQCVGASTTTVRTRFCCLCKHVHIYLLLSRTPNSICKINVPFLS